jgi:regulatory protein YycH of two-component signal transduction system YycFG
LSALFESERTDIAKMIKGVDESLFIRERKLDVKDQYVTIQPGLTVQAIAWVSQARVQIRKPSDSTEKLRFFPDTSVVRQIEEKDARIFTDGQRLLRLTTSGILEYRTADAPGVAPGLSQALQPAQEWIGSHGGWPPDLVLGRFTQELGKAKLEFDHRASGILPVETADGAVQLDISADRITRFRRYPDITEIRFDKERLLLIKPEDAVRIAAQEVSLFLFETVRQMHLAYLLREGRDSDPIEWVLEPSWVIKVGPAKVYVPAELGLDRRVLTIRR